MCTYLTEHVDVRGAAKTGGTWLPVGGATVYFDHPAHLAAEHSLNVDLRAPGADPSARVAVELDADSALALARGILTTLAAAPDGLLPPEVGDAARQLLDPAATGATGVSAG